MYVGWNNRLLFIVCTEVSAQIFDSNHNSKNTIFTMTKKHLKLLHL